MGKISDIVHHGGTAFNTGTQAYDTGKAITATGATGAETEAALRAIGAEQSHLMLVNAEVSFNTNCAQVIKDQAGHQL